MSDPGTTRSSSRLALILRNLTHLRATRDCGSLHRAGDRLGIAQSALSRRIAEVEAELGFPLFDRGPAGMRPTPAGEVFLDDAERLMRDLDRAIRRFELSQSGGAAVLRIGFNSAAVMFPALATGLARFRARHPACDLRLTADLSEAQYAAVQSGRIDIGIAYLLPPDPPLSTRDLAIDRIALAVPGEHPLARATRLSIADLHGQPLIDMQRETSGRLAALVAGRLAAAGVRPRGIMEAGSSEATLNLVAAGLGLAFINRSQADRAPPNVVVRAIDDLDLPLRLAAFWRPDTETPLIRAFVDLIADAFAGSGVMP